MSYRALHNRLNRRFTAKSPTGSRRFPVEDSLSYEDAKPQEGSNHWSSTEYNRNNGRNVNFGSGNANNNNKYNGYVGRAVAVFGDYSVPLPFILSVWEAYHDCLKGKMGSVQAVEYMSIAAYDIPALAYELWSGTYHPGVSTCFLVTYPKLREVFAACFRDRIVHHWVCLRLEPLFEQRFEDQGNVSFNCRKGFGTEKAVTHLAEEMRRVSNNYHNDAVVFRGDIVSFFMSIDKDLLWYLLERFMLRWQKRMARLGDTQTIDGWYGISWSVLCRLEMERVPNMYWDILMRTTKIIVMHHPDKNCILNSPIEWWRSLDASKSLFTSPTGEPIGNLTTQQFANFLMSFFVAYVQYLYRRKNYGMAQFVDDFALTCDDLRYVVRTIPLLEIFLRNKLHLMMHKNKRYLQPVAHGVLFVGTFIKPGRLYLSNRTIARITEKCNGYAVMLANEEHLSIIDLEHIEQVLNSYLGFCRHRATYRFRQHFIAMIGNKFWKFYYVKGHYDSVKLKLKYTI